MLSRYLCNRCLNSLTRQICTRSTSTDKTVSVEKKYTFFKKMILREQARARRCVVFAYHSKEPYKDDEHERIEQLKRTRSYKRVVDTLNRQHGEVRSIHCLSEGLYCVEFDKNDIALQQKIVAVKHFIPKTLKLGKPEAVEGNLSHHLEKLYQFVKLPKSSYKSSFFSAEFIRSFINMTLQSAIVLPFGSAINGHGIKGLSDLDLTWMKEESILHPDISYRDDLHKLSQNMKHVRGSNIFTKMVPILHARVPIVRFNFRITGEVVDLGRGLLSGPLTAETLTWLNHYDDRFSKLVLVIKLLAKNQGVIKAGCKKISSNTLTMLVIAFLQEKKILPPLQEAYSYQILTEPLWVDACLNASRQKPAALRDTTSLGTLFQEFLSFYLENDLRKVCVDVYKGGICHRSPHVSSVLYVLNPFDPNHNVAYNVNTAGLNLFNDFCRQALMKVITTHPSQYNNIWFEQWI